MDSTNQREKTVFLIHDWESAVGNKKILFLIRSLLNL